MRRQKTSLITVAALMTLAASSLGAQSLSELRAQHGARSDRQHTTHKIKKHRTKTERTRKHRTKKERIRKDRTRKHHTQRRTQTRNVKKHAVAQKRELRRVKSHQKRMDRKLNRKHAKRRSFKTIEQFRRTHARPRSSVPRGKRVTHRGITSNKKHFREHSSRRSNRHHRSNRYNSNYYEDEYYDTNTYDRWEPRHTQRAYRHYQRNWYLTYLYERAFFYDRYGYKYGYFNRRGFMFEGEFYRYDRQYTYRDRLRGRGLFEHRYYRPVYSQFNDLFAGIGSDRFYFFANFGF